MTLSILIPTYNYNARALVEDLDKLRRSENVDAEIVVGDDASPEHMTWLDEVATMEGVRVLHYDTNGGRAIHRNRLAEAAQGDWLLFIDCDARVEEDFSLRAYLEAARQAPVVCGGLRTPQTNPYPAASLRYAYERQADRHRSAKERSRTPYTHLTTFNLLVNKALFLSVRFDEHCTEYGYEDALFGVELQQRGLSILHIDNPLVHMGMEPNEVFLQKSETALRTLRGMEGRMRGHSHVENVANRLERLHLAWAVRLFFRLFRGPLRRHLLGSRPNLTLFSLYKLGYFLNLSPHN